MGEYLADTGQLPGDSVKTLTGADNCVHHPIHPLSLVTLRKWFTMTNNTRRNRMGVFDCGCRTTCPSVPKARRDELFPA